MTVLVDNRQDLMEISEDMETLANKIVKAVLDYEDWDDNFEISISFVDNQEMQDLNKEYRNIDAPTDVLSFSMLEFEEDDEGFESDLNDYIEEELPLGDIVISVERAIEQAGEYGHSKDREIAFLLVHGMLHLLGYDHEEKADERVMFQKQDTILGILNINR
ncbi:MAG: rRNA maturation RNase YbeY [Lutispora sp.]|nr:rRNA maturation RNase YbeY [Lutispora sp.]MDD4833328.1 rRNA maturation RNase YbeY [Lutispora sp.]